MKAISIYQPTAAAIALGAKRIETRPWPTKHRGPISIHAAKRWRIHQSIQVVSSWTWCAILRPLGIRMGGDVELESVLSFGAIVAVADLTDCRPTDSFTVGELDGLRRYPADRAGFIPDDGPRSEYADTWSERMLGDFRPGRFGFVLENIRALESPILVRGRQRIFNLDEATASVVRNELALPTNAQAIAGRRWA
jgi:hypothetical protein